MKLNLKKLYRQIFLIVIVLAATATLFSGCKDRNGGSQNINHIQHKSTSAAYTVREYDGKIAVFSGDNSNPDYVLESPLIRDLPFADRQALGEGVEVSNCEELNEVLQDYDN